MLRRCAIAVAIASIAAISRPALAEPAAVSHDVPPGQTRLRAFAAADGLRNLVISGVAQDANGFLWLVTDDGVYRFDGERFTYFSIADGALASVLHVAAAAPDGGVCVGTSSGIVCWDGTRFSRERTRGLPALAVHAMASFAGKLWVGTDGGGLYVQDASGGFVPAPGWPGLPATRIRALWADDQGLVVGDGATVQLSSGNGAWRSIGDVGLGSEPVDGVLRDRQGALWIRTPSHMWFVPPAATRATDLRDGMPTGYGVTGGPAGMAIGPRGDVLIGTDLGIAYREDGRWRTIGRPAGMPAVPVRTVFVDREGTIWVGASGLLQLRGRGVVEYHDVASGLPGDVVWSARRDPRGTLWIGTNRCLARAIEGRWECLQRTQARTVRSFVFPPQGGVFIGGAPSDLLYIDADGRTTSLADHGRSEDRTILALALGPEGDLWIATSAGLYRLRGAVPGPLELVAIPGVHADARFASLAVTGGRLWTATNDGIAVRDRGAWRVFRADAGFRSTRVRRVIARADGRLCASYHEAIGVSCFRYDGATVSDFEHIDPATGLTTGMVYFLGEDPQRRLWIGTGNGVDVVTPNGIDHFDEADGLVGNDSAAMAFMADDDGSIWLGASGGVTHVFSQHYDGPPRPPRTAFLELRIGDQPVRDPRAALEIPHDRGALTLDFASSSMLDAKRVEYQVRLSPLEAQWSATHQREIRYPALLPGGYRFQVRARIGAGRWGDPTELRFTVLPAWWQARWFFALIGAIGLVAIGVGFTWRQRAALRRRTRQLHERSDTSFRAVIDLFPDLISVYRDGQLVYLNLASRRFLGIDDERDDRWKQIQLAALLHPDDAAHAGEWFQRVSNLEPRPASEVVELRMRGPDGTWRVCEVSAICVELGGALTVVTSGRDVTERKRMRAKLLVSDRMASLGTLASGIAHEINNPLAYVTGNLEAMAEVLHAARRHANPPDCDELTAVVADARDGAERVRKIVQGLRSFSRSEAEARAPLALAGVLEAAIRLTANEVRHRAQLVRELGPVPLVIADDGRLTQVFINLLVNAAHAIPDGRSDDNRITVRTRTDDHGRAVVEIQDTGKGMAPDVQARVFDPFFTTKDVGEGTGLGLSICHGIISGLGGQITIESVPGRGTTVAVVLPPVGEPAAAPAPAPAPEPPGEVSSTPAAGRRPRVMLVDDEPQVAHTMERLLRRDYDTTVAACGRDAIELIASGARFDAIVSDVMMPNMTGIDLIEELRRLAPDQAQRLIFLSGGAFTARTRQQLDELGAPQLEKPVSAKELRACIRRVATEPSRSA
jgi:PAS domain S-box-containing protein